MKKLFLVFIMISALLASMNLALADDNSDGGNNGKALPESGVDSNLVVSTKGRLTIITGVIYDASTGDPIEDKVLVRVLCDHETSINTIDELYTDDDGTYWTWTLNIFDSEKCIVGDTAWVEVEYQGSTYEGEKSTVEQKADDHDIAIANAYVGVPEFSTYTLGLAVVFGCLGLVLMRRRH